MSKLDGPGGPIVPEVPEATKAPEVPEATKAPEVQLSEEEATNLVNDFLNNWDTSSLDKLKVIEEKYKSNTLPDNIKLIYENARRNAIEQLVNEPIVAELWLNLDKNNKNAENEQDISTLTPEEADVIASQILQNPEKLINQNSDINKVQQNQDSLTQDLQRTFTEKVQEELGRALEWIKIDNLSTGWGGTGWDNSGLDDGVL